MPEPYGLTVSEAARQILGRQLSPVDLMESLLGRIDSLEPQLKAWVYLDHDAVLAEAKQKQAELDSGARLGPLHGVPIGVKDIYYTAGIPTTACSRLYADFVPEYDCTTVALLKRAGAIMLGKTVTTEFACADPSPTINPWNAAPHPRRLQQRLCGGGRRPHVLRCSRLPDRRLGVAARLLQRRGGVQAQLRAGEPIRYHPCQLVLGPSGVDGPNSGRCCLVDAGDGRP